jgi:H+/Cl- antiporter ClcA/CBS domain-containing protein
MPDELTPRPSRPGVAAQSGRVGVPDPAPTVEPPAPTSLFKGRTGWRQLASWLGSHVNAMSYLWRWLILATVIGGVAGTGAIVFYEALRLSTDFFLSLLAGYHVPRPAGGSVTGAGGYYGAAIAGSSHYARAWAIPLVVIAGALGAGWLVFTWAPEAEGHGTDAAIDAVHYNPRGIRLRAVVVKIVASALTIGSGGSGGREGPTAQISAGFGSLLARALDLSPEDGRIAVSVGIGSGIGAIFSAPLGGAVLAADVVYREDFEYAALVPGLFASIVAYAIFGAVFGYHPLFATPAYHFDQPIQLLWFGIIGLLAGGIGLLYSKGFYGMVRLSHRLPLSRKLRPAAGALFVGLIALALPEVLGTGYGWVQKGLSDQLLHTPLWIILALPFARILATALSIGTGGSGGVFGPGMVIGAFTGLALWRLLEPIAPGVGHDPAPFVVVGMMAVFGGVSRAPLAVMIMVAQMTGSIEILAPAMVAVAIATFTVARFDDSIYRSQLRTRADSEASRFQFGMPLLALLHVGEVAKPPRVVFVDDAPLSFALDTLQRAGVPGAPVVDHDGLYLGTVETSRLAVALENAQRRGTDVGLAGSGMAGLDADEPAAGAPQTPAPPPEEPTEAEEAPDHVPAEPVIASYVDATTTTVPDSARLNVALEALMQAGGRWVTVTSSRRVVGVLSISDLVSGYQRALSADTGRISSVSPSAMTVEERVGEDSPLAGVALSDAGLPPGCIVISIQRGDRMMFATGATVIEKGDLLSALTNPTTAEAVRRIIRGTDEPKPPMVERGSQLV